MAPVTIFDIPLIVEIISENLSSECVRNCNLVCRDWRQTFSPFTWKTINLIRKHSVKRLNTNPEAIHSLKLNASHVKSLTTYHALLFRALQSNPPKSKKERKLEQRNALTLEQQELNNQNKKRAIDFRIHNLGIFDILKESADSLTPSSTVSHSLLPRLTLPSSSPPLPVHIIQPLVFNNLTSIRSLNHHSKAELNNPYVNNILAIVKASPKLVTFEIHHFILRDEQMEPLSSTIGSHPSLKEFILSVEKSVNPLNTTRLFKSCVGLQKLVLHFYPYCASLEPKKPLVDPFPNVTTTNITYLDVREFALYALEAEIFLPFLKKCPKLQHLVAPKFFRTTALSIVVKNSLRELCRLDFSKTRTDSWLLSKVIEACQVLESVKLKGGNFSVKGPVVDAILQPRFLMTLRDICLANCYLLQGSHIQLVLRSCPNLVSFHAMDMDHSLRHCADPILRASDLEANPGWVCHGLEVLAFQYEETEEEIFPRVIYEQVALLYKLEVLFIKRAYLPVPFPTPTPAPAPAPTPVPTSSELEATITTATVGVTSDTTILEASASSTTESSPTGPTVNSAHHSSGELVDHPAGEAVLETLDNVTAVGGSEPVQIEEGGGVVVVTSDSNGNDDDNVKEKPEQEISQEEIVRDKNLKEALECFHSLQNLRELDLTNLYQHFYENQTKELKTAIPTLRQVSLY
ncbi:hypothetical protein BGZ46_006020 [Entomortierella lignicola]|nr:hypothetical protein BGZ46_006020 [Entomortierella lignicola]